MVDTVKRYNGCTTYRINNTGNDGRYMSIAPGPNLLYNFDIVGSE